MVIPLIMSTGSGIPGDRKHIYDFTDHIIEEGFKALSDKNHIYLKFLAKLLRNANIICQDLLRLEDQTVAIAKTLNCLELAVKNNEKEMEIQEAQNSLVRSRIMLIAQMKSVKESSDK